MKQVLILLLSACCLVSCFKDKGNYAYHAINEVSVENLDTSTGYISYFGETLSIAPVIKGSLNNAGAAYRYEWSYENTAQDATVISSEKDLNYKVDLLPGAYTLTYKVTDQASGVQYALRTKLQVSTEVYEGYLVLNDVEGKARLDMLSYKRETGTFQQYTDVLAKMGSSLPELQGPHKVFCMHAVSTSNADPKMYKIYISGASGTNSINSETFDYTPTDNIRYEMAGDVPQNFTADNFFGLYQASTIPTMYMHAENSVFLRRNNYLVFPYVPLNIYAGESVPFKASPYMAASSSYVMIFNMDKRVFTRTQSTNSAFVYDMPPALNYPVGKDLVYMEMVNATDVYAIMKDPATSVYSLIRAAFGQALNYNEVITATDFDAATHFAVSPDKNYLFYSAGGKVYEYDLSLKTSKLMLDKGPEEITYLAFQNFFFRSLDTNYDEWSRLLSVGSYQSAAPAGTGGTLEQYSVPNLNGPLESRYQWTGLGKIVSIDYRERKP